MIWTMGDCVISFRILWSVVELPFSNEEYCCAQRLEIPSASLISSAPSAGLTDAMHLFRAISSLGGVVEVVHAGA